MIAALKISDVRIAVWWGMIPCSVHHSPGLNFSGLQIEGGGKQENSHQAGIPANPGCPGALEQQS